MNLSYLRVKKRGMVLVKECYIVRFDDATHLPHLNHYEPNYYQLKLHVDLISVVDELFTNTTKLGYGTIEWIAEEIMNNGLIEEGCTREGLTKILADIYQSCIDRVAFTVGTLDFKLISCIRLRTGAFSLLIERWQ